jgi:hypothetical protein
MTEQPATERPDSPAAAATWSDPEVATMVWTIAALASIGAVAVSLLAAWWWAVLVPVGYAVMAVRAYLWMRGSDAKHSSYSAPSGGAS